MKTNALILFGLGIFFSICTITYIAMNAIIQPLGKPVEWVGTTILIMSVFFALFPAFFLWRASKSLTGTLPEDDVDARIEDADPDYGFFSPHSWWPLGVAASLGVLTAGIAVGIWLFVIGLVLLIVTVIGFVFEFHRGAFSH